MHDILPPGTTLEGRYRLVSEAEPQDMGHLYRGYDTVDDQLVMVLVLPYPVTAGSEVLSRLSRVQRAVAGLGHPGLVGYEYGGVAAGRLYLVRRHVAGRPLADLIDDGPLDPATAASIAIALADLVAFLHRAGLVHGSLSPYCVYVDLSGATPAMSLTDCGLCPALRDIQALPSGPWGRLPYLSPEHAAGQDAHPASDVYVIGSLLYAMLAGRPPFRADDQTVLVVQHLRQEPPALDVLLPNLSPALAKIVHQALAKEPAARYRHAGQLAQILRSQLGMPAGGGASPRAAAASPLYVSAPPRGPVVVPADAPQVVSVGPAVDWVMIALIILALLAMFGLVRLWRAVYERYTAPGAAMLSTMQVVYSPAGLPDWPIGSVRSVSRPHYPGAAAPVMHPWQSKLTMQPAEATTPVKELVHRRVIWYNRLAARCARLCQVMESRLRVSRPGCATLSWQAMVAACGWQQIVNSGGGVK